ncbi:Uncharacterized protein TCM_023802 [Theobroma cacao]|uniref:Uncharacterized protein n=1 Tax=Theobroma cacao TaxID=3641 RepID=A0A061EUI7_THECC|nr:Uncharacterized protein TCM_023802 [Theobroma cacao]
MGQQAGCSVPKKQGYGAKASESWTLQCQEDEVAVHGAASKVLNTKEARLWCQGIRELGVTAPKSEGHDASTIFFSFFFSYLI